MAFGTEYLTGYLGHFLRKGDPVLICFPSGGPDSLGHSFYHAAEAVGALPRYIDADRRWKGLLRLAFECRAGTLIGPPAVILGLVKLARAKKTPLYIRNVVTAQGPCPDWISNGLKHHLDCDVWDLENESLDISDPQRELGLLWEEISHWTSVLDCRVCRGAGGLEIELISFPGEKLPRLPTCAKLIVRPWEPEVDEPFHLEPHWKNPAESLESH